jgi:hypothetical protein
MRYNVFALLLIVMLAVAGTGCTSQTVQPPQNAMDAANATADTMFPALNSGEYAVFSQNLSATMKSAMNESYFNKMIGQMSGQYGRYISRSAVPQASVVGDYNVFVYPCQFEKTKLNVQLTMNKTDVWKVEGFFYR